MIGLMSVAEDLVSIEFESRVDTTLQTCCVLARSLIGAHQAAMSLIVAGDWAHARKYFSLSDKYAAYRDFRTPGRGIGLHAVVVEENRALRLTQDEVERHPAWRGFAETAATHQPLRGLLAVPIVGEDGLNCGLLQVSDKIDGTDFDEDDERRLQGLASLGALALDALARVRRLRSGEDVPILEHESMAEFVHIERV
jgi:GAF domain-containing protein